MYNNHHVNPPVTQTMTRLTFKHLIQLHVSSNKSLTNFTENDFPFAPAGNISLFISGPTGCDFVWILFWFCIFQGLTLDQFRQGARSLAGLGNEVKVQISPSYRKVRQLLLVQENCVRCPWALQAEFNLL